MQRTPGIMNRNRRFIDSRTVQGADKVYIVLFGWPFPVPEYRVVYIVSSVSWCILHFLSLHISFTGLHFALILGLWDYT